MHIAKLHTVTLFRPIRSLQIQTVLSTSNSPIMSNLAGTFYVIDGSISVFISSLGAISNFV